MSDTRETPAASGGNGLTDSIRLLRHPAHRWEMFALRLDDGGFYAVGSEWYARAHGSGEDPVPVVVTEDAEGGMLGWISTGKDGVPEMIQRRHVFEIQFSYGSKFEVDRGAGVVVPLRVEGAALS